MLMTSSLFKNLAENNIKNKEEELTEEEYDHVDKNQLIFEESQFDDDTSTEEISIWDYEIETTDEEEDDYIWWTSSNIPGIQPGELSGPEA